MSAISLAPHSTGKSFQIIGVLVLLAGAGCIVYGVKGPAELDKSSYRLLVELIGAMVVAFGIFFLYLGGGINKVGVQLTGSELVVSGPMYGRTIPRKSLKVAEAKIVELKSSYAPTRRRNGIGLSRLKFGWFKLDNDEKALVVVGDMDKAVYVPTTEDFSLLITPSDPDAFLAALK